MLPIARGVPSTDALEACGLPIAARIRGRDVAIAVAYDDLAGAEIHVGIGDRGEAMPQRRETVLDRGRYARFEIDRKSRVDLPARGVQHRLRLLAIVEQPHEGLHVTLRLDRAAHHADGGVGLAVAHHEARNDGMERPLPRADLIRMPARE